MMVRTPYEENQDGENGNGKTTKIKTDFLRIILIATIPVLLASISGIIWVTQVGVNVGTNKEDVRECRDTIATLNATGSFLARNLEVRMKSLEERISEVRKDIVDIRNFDTTQKDRTTLIEERQRVVMETIRDGFAKVERQLEILMDHARIERKPVPTPEKPKFDYR